MADDRSFVVVLMADSIVLIIVPFPFQRLELAALRQHGLASLDWRDLVYDRKEIQAFFSDLFYKYKVLAYSQWDLLWNCGSDGRRRMPRTHPTSTSGHTEHSERFKTRGVCQYRNYKPFDDNKCGSNFLLPPGNAHDRLHPSRSRATVLTHSTRARGTLPALNVHEE
jgi:hypothetical protein